MAKDALLEVGRVEVGRDVRFGGRRIGRESCHLVRSEKERGTKMKDREREEKDPERSNGKDRLRDEDR